MSRREQKRLNEDLYTACDNGDVSEVKKLLSRGGDVNYRTTRQFKFNYTPLHASAREGHEDVIKLLLEQPAVNVDSHDSTGATPLHECAEEGRPAVAKLLLDAGASLSSVSNSGTSPLYYAALNGHLDTVELFVLRGADLSLCNKNGDSPLHDAAYMGHLDTAKFLLQHGSNMSLRNKLGQTALDRARVGKRTFSSRGDERDKVVHYLESVESQSASTTATPTTSTSPQQPTESQSASTTATPTTSTSPQQPTVAGIHNRNLVSSHIQQQGSVGVLSLKSFFIGPSCVGKTTARRRLTHEIDHLSPNEIVPSTGIDAPLTVQLYHETDRSSVLLSERGWRCMGLEEQGLTLCSQVINTPLSPPSSSSDTRPSSQSTATALPVPTGGKTKPLSKLLNRIKQKWKNRNLSASHSDDTKEATALTDELTTALSSLVKHKDWESIRDFLKETDMLTLLHIVDIGGQPECHEILPLLLHGLALNLIFLNVTQDLDSPYTVVYRGEGGFSPIQYKSEFTIREIIQRALCSIASLQTSADHKPAAILIGTYLDQSSKAAVLTLDRSIQEAFKDADFMKNDILCPVSKPGEEERYIHPLDNVSSGSSDIEELRQLITTIVHKRFPPVQVPTSTLLLHLILRLRFEVRGWCTVRECVEVANICGISEKDLLAENGILQYLHDRFGTILHYRGLKIGQRVIINTNIIMAPTTELFVYAFGAKEAEPKTADRIRTTGEIPQRLMNKICSSENVKHSENKIPTSEIVELLASRYILYENVRSANKETTYFLPSLLFPDHKVAMESSDPALLSALFYSPILLWPSTGFTPLGMFPATVIKLSQKKSWRLDERNRFRNRIRFYVQYSKEKLLHVELRTLSTHLEFRIVPAAKLVNPRLIPEVRQELWDAVIEVSSFYPHTKEVEWQHGFYCPHSVNSGGRPHPALCQTMEEPQDVVCSLPDCHGGQVDLEDRHKCWFTEVQIDTDSHRNDKLKEPAHDKFATQLPTAAAGVSGDISRTLSENDLCDVLAVINDLNNWEELGLQLGLLYSTLERINLEQQRRISSCKIHMLSAWLQRQDNVSQKGVPSWSVLRTALQRMGEHETADRISN